MVENFVRLFSGNAPGLLQSYITSHVFVEQTYALKYMLFYSVSPYPEGSVVIDKELEVREVAHFGVCFGAKTATYVQELHIHMYVVQRSSIRIYPNRNLHVLCDPNNLHSR
jgi:hypothetical protein